MDNVSITLGFNELAALASLPRATVSANIPQTLSDYGKNYSAVLTEVRSLSPDAQLSLLGYFNPIPFLPIRAIRPHRSSMQPAYS